MRSNLRPNDPALPLIRIVVAEIAEEMDRQGVTQRELARRMGTSTSAVSEMLQGTNMTLRTLARVGTVLGCDINVVLLPRD